MIIKPTIEILGPEAEKRGPKEKYKPEFCNNIADVASQGGHIPAMMLSIGVKSKDTWYRWQREHSEFKEAVEYAELISQAYYEKLGLDACKGLIPNFSASTYAIIVNNKFSKEYKRNPTGTEINITTNNVNLTPEQLQQKIAQKIEKLKSLGEDITIEHSA